MSKESRGKGKSARVLPFAQVHDECVSCRRMLARAAVRRMDGKSVGMRRGHSPRTCVRQTARSPSARQAVLLASAFAGVAARCLARRNSARGGTSRGKRRERTNWPNCVQLLRTAHLQSDVTAGSHRAAIYIQR